MHIHPTQCSNRGCCLFRLGDWLGLGALWLRCLYRCRLFATIFFEPLFWLDPAHGPAPLLIFVRNELFQLPRIDIAVSGSREITRLCFGLPVGISPCVPPFLKYLLAYQHKLEIIALKMMTINAKTNRCFYLKVFELGGVQIERLYKGNVRAKTAMKTRAVDAEKYAQITRIPAWHCLIARVVGT